MGATLNGDRGDRLPRSEMPINLQWSTGQTISKGLESNDVNSLSKNKVPYSNRESPSLMKTTRLQGVL